MNVLEKALSLILIFMIFITGILGFVLLFFGKYDVAKISIIGSIIGSSIIFLVSNIKIKYKVDLVILSIVAIICTIFGINVLQYGVNQIDLASSINTLIVGFVSMIAIRTFFLDIVFKNKVIKK